MQINSQIEQQSNQPKTKKLWGKLKNFLLKKDEFILNQQMYLNILPQILRQNDVIEYNLGQDNLFVLIQKQRQSISLDEMKKFNEAKVDSTGVSLWPAEELLAYYCLKNIEKFRPMKRIAEYGAGYSGLAGITLAKSLLYKIEDPPDYEIQISDGNQECANLLKDNILLNKSNALDCNFQKCISSRQYVWEENGTELSGTERFDSIIIADCLFFRDYHNALIKTIQNTLSFNNGECIIIAPQRGGTLNEFVQKCQGQLSISPFLFKDETYQNIVNKIKENPSYNQDMHEYFFFSIKNNINQ